MFICSSPAIAQCPPQDYLAPDIDLTSSASTFRLSYLKSISKDRFEELKRNGKLNVTLPNIPLVSDLTYDDFKKIIDKELQNEKLDVSQSQFNTMMRSHISSEGVKAYIACLQRNDMQTEVTVPPEAATQSNFFITLVWRGPRGTAAGKFDNVGPHHFQIFGGEIPDEEKYDKDQSLSNGQEYKIKVKRNLSEPFGFSASVGGQSSEVNLPPTPKPNKIRFDVVSSPETSAYGDGLNAQHNPYCLSAKNNEQFLVSTIKIVNRVQAPSNGRAWTDLNGTPTDKSICATAHAVLNGGKGATRLWSHIEVLRMTDPDEQP
jgi:hypothetical protein